MTVATLLVLVFCVLLASAQAQTLESMQEVGKKAKVFKSITDQEVMVTIDTNPELAHAFEALLARGLARELPEGGIRLRSDITQADINAALARKSWAISLEVRKLRNEVSRIDEDVKNLGQKWNLQNSLNWIFGLAIFALFAILAYQSRNALMGILPKNKEQIQTKKEGDKKEEQEKKILPSRLKPRTLKLKPSKSTENKEENVAV